MKKLIFTLLMITLFAAFTLAGCAEKKEDQPNPEPATYIDAKPIEENLADDPAKEIPEVQIEEQDKTKDPAQEQTENETPAEQTPDDIPDNTSEEVQEEAPPIVPNQQSETQPIEEQQVKQQPAEPEISEDTHEQAPAENMPEQEPSEEATEPETTTKVLERETTEDASAGLTYDKGEEAEKADPTQSPEETIENTDQGTDTLLPETEQPEEIKEEPVEETPAEQEPIIRTEYITEYVTEYVTPEEPVGYLKDNVTKEGVLGVDYPVVSNYGPRSDLSGQISGNHKGIDFAMDVGTELLAPDNCVVAYVGNNDQRGNWVVMYWGHGHYIEYQHMSEVTVKMGDQLKKGDTVGYSGDTGASLIPHLHLEIIQDETGGNTITDFNNNSTRINPYYFIFGTEDVELP